MDCWFLIQEQLQLTDQPGIESKKIVSYLPERTYLPEWMRVDDTIEFFSDFYQDFDKKKAYEMLERLHLNSKAKLKSLSKGTKKRFS